MASRVASTALTTEAQPLMPQAQGTSAGASRLTRASARGNGMPMQNASGAIAASASGSLASSGRVIRNAVTGVRTAR